MCVFWLNKVRARGQLKNEVSHIETHVLHMSSGELKCLFRNSSLRIHCQKIELKTPCQTNEIKKVGQLLQPLSHPRRYGSACDSWAEAIFHTKHPGSFACGRSTLWGRRSSLFGWALQRNENSHNFNPFVEGNMALLLYCRLFLSRAGLQLMINIFFFHLSITTNCPMQVGKGLQPIPTHVQEELNTGNLEPPNMPLDSEQQSFSL